MKLMSISYRVPQIVSRLLSHLPPTSSRMQLFTPPTHNKLFSLLWSYTDFMILIPSSNRQDQRSLDGKSWMSFASNDTLGAC